MDWPARTANAVVRALAAVGIVVPLPKNPRAATLELPPISWTREMGGFFMSGRTLYDIELRRRAVELYEEGHGRDVISYLLNVPEGTVRQWPDTYRSVGMGALTAIGTR